MPGKFNHNVRDTIGSWTLIEPLNAGGNAEVWRASHSDGRIVALKILYAKKTDSEPYKRFKAEIDFLHSLGEQPGVLPIIEASLPQRPSKKNPAWFAMPIATPISEALGDAPDIHTVVETVAAIAETLTLLAEKKVSHRDIKPGNLYSFEGNSTIGDFGLVEYPEKEAITEDGKTLGPRFFMAPEMISDPKNADGTLADVYSLAKTLWVLATGQNYPPQGEQRIDVPQLTIEAYVSHPKIRFLDSLIERSTRHNPNMRPGMGELASELRAWLEPSTEPATPTEVSDLIQRIVIASEPSSRAAEIQNGQKEEARLYIERFQPRFEQLTIDIEKTGLANERLSGRMYPFFWAKSPYNYELWEIEKQRVLGDFAGNYIVFSDCLGIVIQGLGRDPSKMVCGVLANLFEDGVIELMAGYDFDVNYYPEGLSYCNWINHCHAPSGSIMLDRCFTSLVDMLSKNLRPALEHFAKLLELQPK